MPRRRCLCGAVGLTCGSAVALSANQHPGEMHFYASLLGDHGALRPEVQVHWEERVAWVSPADDLPRRAGRSIGC